jgi:hypothetical protein
MLFILEVINCSGKKTLYFDLCRLFGIKYFNERRTRYCFVNINNDYRDIVAKYILYLELEFAKLFNFCMDRFHISEAAYRMIEGRTIDYFDDFESELLSIHHLLIFCCPDYGLLEKKIIERDGFVPDKFYELYCIFLDLFKRSKLNKILIKPF